MTSLLLWQCLLLHTMHCSLMQWSWLIPLSVSLNSDESGKQSLYPDGDPDDHQNLTICSLAHCHPSLKLSCKSMRKFFSAKLVTDRETDKRRRKHNLVGRSNNFMHHCRDEAVVVNCELYVGTIPCVESTRNKSQSLQLCCTAVSSQLSGASYVYYQFCHTDQQPT